MGINVKVRELDSCYDVSISKEGESYDFTITKEMIENVEQRLLLDMIINRVVTTVAGLYAKTNYSE